MNYKAIIGLEIHCELKTKTKMFCSCTNSLGMEAKPNMNICPVCTGQPGTLPVPNKKAIELVIKTGLALNCEIAKISKFDRKNYFYPDLPKGYQISQYDQPLCENGNFVFTDANNNQTIKVRINRIHIEEDTGKSIHSDIDNSSLIDLNRAGVPLMELVTEADIRTANDAKLFCQELQKVFRYLDISDADMEKGHMRCEANISIMPEDLAENSDNFGTKVEIKNLNSFKSVEKAINFEIERQTKLLNNNEEVKHETRGWHDKKQITFAQRSKEQAADYRYFPEPDIPPMQINHTDFVKPELEKQNEIYLLKIKSRLGELPYQREQRFIEEYNMILDDAKLIASEKKLANYTEQMIGELQEWFESIYKGQALWEDEKEKMVKMAVGWLTSKLFKLLDDNNIKIEQCKITPENFAELISIMYSNQINSSAGQIVLDEMFKHGYDPTQVIDEKQLLQISNSDEITPICQKIINNFPQQVEQYKNGKIAIIKFLLGQVMKESKGKVNPQVAEKKLEELLNN